MIGRGQLRDQKLWDDSGDQKRKAPPMQNILQNLSEKTVEFAWNLRKSSITHDQVLPKCLFKICIYVLGGFSIFVWGICSGGVRGVPETAKPHKI